MPRARAARPAYPKDFPRFARYGPADRYFSAPPAGFCISVFAVARRGPRLLAGLPDLAHPRWEREWLPNVRAYAKEDREEYAETLQVPCTYLREHEHPDDALARVLRAQVGARSYEATALEIVSASAQSTWYPGERHWDLAFVYLVDANAPAKPPRWWHELSWMDTRKLRASDFGWNGDMLVDLGVLAR
ncbi:MAG TPA: hypothetical protein VM681_10900 [Candidatus Thermoplasmatota archaeon]|nr:hypothetical protein [Candidatus Thermoplasmatota archaeon]